MRQLNTDPGRTERRSNTTMRREESMLHLLVFIRQRHPKGRCNNNGVAAPEQCVKEHPEESGHNQGARQKLQKKNKLASVRKQVGKAWGRRV
jgi:hypothetical protein